MNVNQWRAYLGKFEERLWVLSEVHNVKHGLRIGQVWVFDRQAWVDSITWPEIGDATGHGHLAEKKSTDKRGNPQHRQPNTLQEVSNHCAWIFCWFVTPWQHPWSYQCTYWLVSVHTHGDFIVLPHWATRPPAPWPDILLSHIFLTLSHPVLAIS